MMSSEREPAGEREPRGAGRSALGARLARGVVAAGALGLVRLALLWTPGSPHELWPARLGELGRAPLDVAAVLVACLASAALPAALGLVGRLVAALLCLLALAGVPAHVPPAAALEDALREPWHALVALLAALGAARYLAAPRAGRPAASALAAGGAGLLLAFAGGPLLHRDVADELPPLLGERTLFSLLDDATRFDVRRQSSAHPVRVSTFAANSLTQLDAGNLPVLEMTPPAEVRIELPPTLPGAVLRLAAGVASESYVSATRTQVRLEARFRGAEVHTAKLTTWKGAQPNRRVWKRAEVPVEDGGTLVLRTSFDGPPEEAPRAGFGLLDVVGEVQGRRTLASRAAPNVLLVVIDTLRADRLGTYGNPRPASPALDALAERGTVFETAYAPASWTWPSTTSLLTSLSPPEHGVTDPTSCYLSDGLVTLAEVFQDAGFTTAAFSSNPLVSADKNFDKGFETFREYRWDPAEVVVADVVDWLEELGRYRFFVYLHLIDPHGPYEPDERFAEAFGLPQPARYSEKLHKELVDGLRQSEAIDYAQLERHSEYLSSLYDGEVATADQALGELFARLEELGLARTTVVAVTSDHGEEFLEHGMMGHGRQVFAESVRVPLIVAGPGVPAGNRVGLPVENRFLGPTLFAATGVVPRDNLAGRPDLLDPADRRARRAEPIFFSSELGWWPGHGARPLLAVEHDGRLLIWSPASEGSSADRALGELVALFDLSEDPQARRDVARERPDEVARLRDRIRAWIAAGDAVRPTVFDGGDEVRAMLQELGYIGAPDE